MASQINPVRVPAYRLHKPSGRAVVTLGGRDHYLGAHGSVESHSAYRRIIAEWMAGGHQQPTSVVGERLVGELALAYLEQERRNGRDGLVKPAIRAAMRRLTTIYAPVPVRAFGPLQLKALQRSMTEESTTLR